MLESTTIIAFDQHAATTVAAVLLPSHRTPALHTLTSDTATIVGFVERLRRQGPVVCCYEAGPCGFERQRGLTARALPCDVIAPFTFPPSRRRRRAIYCAVARTSKRISFARGIASRSFCSATGAASRRPRQRRAPGTTRGSGDRPGRSPRSTRPTRRTCAPSMKPWRGGGRSNSICARSTTSSRSGHASSGCAVFAASTTSRR